jgi:dephospho-CoA kinase
METVIFNASFRRKGSAFSPDARPPLVAVTGGIACGKSAFGRALAASGADVADTDEIVHRLQRPGQPLALAIGQAFGPECLRSDGSVDRPALARIVFQDPAQLKRLNALSHPLVRRVVQDWCREPSGAWLKACLIPLLFETGWESDWNWTLCVACSPETQLKRLLERGLTAEDARRRIAAQASPEEKAARADIVIRNDGSLDDLRRSVETLRRRLQESLHP